MKNLGGKSTNKLTPGTKVPKGVLRKLIIPRSEERSNGKSREEHI